MLQSIDGCQICGYFRARGEDGEDIKFDKTAYRVPVDVGGIDIQSIEIAIVYGPQLLLNGSKTKGADRDIVIGVTIVMPEYANIQQIDIEHKWECEDSGIEDKLMAVSSGEGGREADSQL